MASGKGRGGRNGQGFRDMTSRWTAERVERVVQLLHEGDRLQLQEYLEKEVPRLPHPDDPPGLLDLKGIHFENLDYQPDLGAVKMERINFFMARMEKVNMKEAQLSKCSLRHARFEDAFLYRTRFQECDLQGSQFRDTFMLGIRFEQSHLRYCSWSNCRLDLRDFPKVLEEENLKRYDQASDIYRSLRLNLQAIGDGQGAGEAALRQQIASRRHAWVKKKYQRWVFLGLQDLIWGYAERPNRLAAFSFILCLCFAIGFFILGVGTSGICADRSTQTLGEIIEHCLYLSFVTFTTVGYGDFSPCTTLGRLLACCEAFSGVFIMGLFVSAYGRKFAGE